MDQQNAFDQFDEAVRRIRRVSDIVRVNLVKGTFGNTKRNACGGVF